MTAFPVTALLPPHKLRHCRCKTATRLRSRRRRQAWLSSSNPQPRRQSSLHPSGLARSDSCSTLSSPRTSATRSRTISRRNGRSTKKRSKCLCHAASARWHLQHHLAALKVHHRHAHRLVIAALTVVARSARDHVQLTRGASRIGSASVTARETVTATESVIETVGTIATATAIGTGLGNARGTAGATTMTGGVATTIATAATMTGAMEMIEGRGTRGATVMTGVRAARRRGKKSVTTMTGVRIARRRLTDCVRR